MRLRVCFSYSLFIFMTPTCAAALFGNATGVVRFLYGDGAAFRLNILAVPLCGRDIACATRMRTVWLLLRRYACEPNRADAPRRIAADRWRAPPTSIVSGWQVHTARKAKICLGSPPEAVRTHANIDELAVWREPLFTVSLFRVGVCFFFFFLKKVRHQWAKY